MRGVAIETSCDEPSAAVLTGTRRGLVANAVETRVPDHRPFGGVVPERVARRQVERIPPAVEHALDADAAWALPESD